MAGNVNQTVTVTAAEILQGAGTLTMDGRDVGSYEGGVQIEFTQTEVFVKSDYSLGDIDSEIVTVEAKLKTNLEQATLENIATCLGISSSSVLSGTSSKTLSLVFPKTMREVALVFLSMSATDRTKNRTWTFGRAVKVGTTGLPFKRGEKTLVPVEFRILQNLTTESFGTASDNTI